VGRSIRQARSTAAVQISAHEDARPVTVRGRYEKISLIRADFRRAESLDDVQARGYILEHLLLQLARLTVGLAVPSYRFDRAAGGASQVDGYIEHGSDRYRVECKWQHKPAERTDIIVFANKLDAVGVGGLFVSMSGFAESAIQQARELSREKVILFIDGSELEAALERRVNFDELLAMKRLNFNQRSDPYVRVTPSQEVT
jgi:hypothetical protein